MTRICVIALARFREQAERIAGAVDGDVIEYVPGVFGEYFYRCEAIVAVMSAGIAVRCIAPHLRDKWIDPPLVVVSPDLRFAVPVLGGHHGGNRLARKIAGDLSATAVISTATECAGRPSVEGIADATGCAVLNPDSTRAVNTAELDGAVPVYRVVGPAIVIAGPAVSLLLRKGEYVVGVGCRRGVTADEVEGSIRAALADASVDPDQVFVYATTNRKREESGLQEGVARLGGSLVLVDDVTLNDIAGCGPSRAGLIGLAGVAEPAALAVSRRKEWRMRKAVYGRVTVAVAR
ncbi:MAG: cobalt-precorrin 5A hydrolase [Methanospirillum sp.]|nr:cobalt-precorrin 5A hydrolase [Methanospirillum sp.]